MFYPRSKQIFKICAGAALSLCAISVGMAAETTRVSVSSAGVQGNNGSGPQNIGSSISANGRYVAYASYASNLVTGDTNTFRDIFVYDRQSKQTTRVSVASDGTQGNSDSADPKISADGRFVAFSSIASNLAPSDGITESVNRIFIHDRQTRQTSKISLGFRPSISADGRFVAFDSTANNLVVGDTNAARDVFVYDRQTKQTSRVSIASNGGQANNYSGNPSISADGRFVAFDSVAGNLVSGGWSAPLNVYVHDRLTKQTSLISVAINGQVGAEGGSFRSSISADGRFVAFESTLNNLVVGDTNSFSTDVFVHDRLTKQTSLADVASNGIQASDALLASISADGRYVAFVSRTDDFVGDTNQDYDIFVCDRKTKQITPIIDSTSGVEHYFTGNGLPAPAINADGRFVVFSSFADNLIAGDTNLANDVFVRDRLVNNALSADLKVTNTLKPASLVVNTTGTYQYTVTNVGPNTAADVRISHIVSNGSQLVSLVPSQGYCNRYSTIGLCRFGTLLSGQSLTITAVAKATRSPLEQRLTVTGAPKDPVSSNNYLFVTTLVTP